MDVGTVSFSRILLSSHLMGTMVLFICSLIQQIFVCLWTPVHSWKKEQDTWSHFHYILEDSNKPAIISLCMAARWEWPESTHAKDQDTHRSKFQNSCRSQNKSAGDHLVQALKLPIRCFFDGEIDFHSLNYFIWELFMHLKSSLLVLSVNWWIVIPKASGWQLSWTAKARTDRQTNISPWFQVIYLPS